MSAHRFHMKNCCDEQVYLAPKQPNLTFMDLKFCIWII